MLCEWYLKEVIVSDSLIFDLKITPDRLPVLKLIYAKSECIGCCFCDTLMDKAMGFNSLHMLFSKILQEL